MIYVTTTMNLAIKVINVGRTLGPMVTGGIVLINTKEVTRHMRNKGLYGTKEEILLHEQKKRLKPI